MLSVKDLVVSYQELRALQGVSLEIEEGELVALIGSNGSGKTTLLNAISGLAPADEGEIAWKGKPIRGLAPGEICGQGIVQVPEGRKLFPRMTIDENLEMGAYLPASRARLKENRQKVFDLLPRLAERRRQLAGSLSGGEQQMLALARALMAQPTLLMLDEPSLGLSPVAAAEIFRIISDLNKGGLTVLLISQEVLETLSIARHGYIIEHGRIALKGLANELKDDPRIKESYLGI